ETSDQFCNISHIRKKRITQTSTSNQQNRRYQNDAIISQACPEKKNDPRTNGTREHHVNDISGSRYKKSLTCVINCPTANHHGKTKRCRLNRRELELESNQNTHDQP